jgi:hypothetical protein
VYGNYNIIDFSISNEEIEMKIEKRAGFFSYQRIIKKSGDRAEKIVLADDGHVIVNPVEPVNLPREVTSYLQIEFEKPVLVEPHGKKKIYVKFPIEVGVFIAGKRSIEVADIFTLTKPKYTLYGNPRNGVICRYWKSDIYPEIPKTNSLIEGVIELNIENEDDEWIEVRRVVFNAVGMKIYYDQKLVSMRASMKILSPVLAETDFFTKAIRDGMKKSLELYTARRIVVPTGKFVMEMGL